jgi:hypothetical protein
MSKGKFAASSGTGLTVQATQAADAVSISTQGGDGVFINSVSGTSIFAESLNPSYTAWIGNFGSGTAIVAASGLGGGFGSGISATSDSGMGLFASSNFGEGIVADSPSSTALAASSQAGTGVDAYSIVGPAVAASCDGQAVVAQSTSQSAIVGYGNPNASAAVFSNMRIRRDVEAGSTVTYYQAAEFFGNVSITGSFTVSGTKGFRIDHPIEPKKMWLHHAAVESDVMKNMYDGIVSLDSAGKAFVRLPKWFEALNKDFRYLLTAIGASAPDLHIAREIRNGRFSIAGGKSKMKVSWQITGIRKDAWARTHPFATEEAKSKEERGSVICPERKKGQKASLSSSISEQLESADDFRKAASERKKRYAAIKKLELKKRPKS